jgi:hypothetical protein
MRASLDEGKGVLGEESTLSARSFRQLRTTGLRSPEHIVIY